MRRIPDLTPAVAWICHFGHLYTDKGKSHIRNISRKTKVYGIYYIMRNFTLSFNKMEKNEKIFINGKRIIIEKQK